MNRPDVAGLIVVSSCLLSGCGQIEINYVLSQQSKETLDQSAQEQLATALDKVFGTPAAPHASETASRIIGASDEQLADGARTYRLMCMHCHGLTGDGNGPTAGPKERPWLNPRPRDYRQGTFKFTSTAGGSKPTRADLLRTIRNGVPGTSMPSFALYYDDNPERIEHVLDYVLLLSLRGQTERFVVDDYQAGDQITGDVITENATVVARQWTGTEEKIVQPKVPRHGADPKSLNDGKELFLSDKVQCHNCHGRQGRGDGLETNPKKTTDDWGNPSRPADLTLGVFRGGARPLDVFRRIHDGVKGTPMPAQSGNLSDEQIWDLVNYVRTLAYLSDDEVVAQAASGGGESPSKQN